MNIRAAMMAACAGAQARLQPKPGLYLRGVLVVQVLSVDGDEVRWQEVASGRTFAMDRAAFASRAVVPLPLPNVAAPSETDSIWAIASLRTLPADQRLTIILATYPDAVRDAGPDGEVIAWVDALRGGREPTKAVA